MIMISKHDNDDDVEFIVNTADDPGLGMSSDGSLHEQADFVSFDFEDDENNENNVDLNNEDNYSS